MATAIQKWRKITRRPTTPMETIIRSAGEVAHKGIAGAGAIVKGATATPPTEEKKVMEFVARSEPKKSMVFRGVSGAPSEPTPTLEPKEEPITPTDSGIDPEEHVGTMVFEKPIGPHSQIQIRQEIVTESILVRAKEKEFISGIDPTKRYEYKLTSPEEWAYVHSIVIGEPHTFEWGKGRIGQEFVPYSVFISGAEIIEGAESLAKHREEGVTGILRWVAEHPVGTTYKTTDTGYKATFPSHDIDTDQQYFASLSVWKPESWIKDPVGTLAGGVADILQPIQTRLSEDWLIGPTYKKLTGVTATKEQMWEASREQWRQRVEQKDYGAMAMGVLTSPLGLIGGSYALGKGFGVLAGTKVGQKPLFDIGFFEKEIASAPKWTYKYTYTITPTSLIKGGMVGYFGYEGIKGGITAYEEGTLPQYIATLGILFPLIYVPFKAGYKSGLGWIQRRSAMGKVTGLDRVRQEAIYDSMKQVKTLREPRFDTEPFNLTDIQRIDSKTALRLNQFLTTEQRRWIFGGQPRIGGSVSTRMQMRYEAFRTDIMPKGLRYWAIQRQATSGRIRPLIGEQGPVDIDLWLREFWKGATKRASYIKKSHVVDIPKGGYKAGRYYGYGYTELRSTTGYIQDPFFKAMKVKILPSQQMQGIMGQTYVERSFRSFLGTDTARLYPKIELSSLMAEPKKGGIGYISKKYFPRPIDDPTWVYRGKIILKHEIIHQLHPHWPEFVVKLAEGKYFFKKMYKSSSDWFKTSKLQIEKTTKVKTLSLKEQFTRKSISILPSEKSTAYRSYKDIPDWWDIGKAFGDTTLDSIMHKVAYPELYKIPKTTFGEWIVKRIGGAVETIYEPAAGGLRPMLPKGVYPKELFGKYPLHYTPTGISSYLSAISTQYRVPIKYDISKISVGEKYKGPPISKYISKFLPDTFLITKPIVTFTEKKYTEKIQLFETGYPITSRIYIPPVKTTSEIYTAPPPDKAPPIIIPSKEKLYSAPSYKEKKPHKQRFILPLPDSGKVLKAPLQQGYEVLIKERYIFEGKKRKPQRFSKVAIHPLTKEDALSFGSHLVDQSTARSFKVRPTTSAKGKKHYAQDLKIYVAPWGISSYKFYTKGDTYIEKTAFAIDTKGELEGITYKGILASMRKRQKAMISSKILGITHKKAQSKATSKKTRPKTYFRSATQSRSILPEPMKIELPIIFDLFGKKHKRR